ncbi:MAG: hypothetical protein WBD25_18015 [Terriglobales bacterium]|jgi:hypothetical protein
MKQREYIEGPEAFANFEQFARAILQAPKPKIKAKKQPKTASSRKPKKADKD